MKEPWQMDLAEWQAAAERGQIVPDEGPVRDLQAVLSGKKPATDFEIHTGHPLVEMYESGELEERVRAAGAVVGQDAAAVERLDKALAPIHKVVESEESVVIPCLAPASLLRGAECGSLNTAVLPTGMACGIRVI